MSKLYIREKLVSSSEITFGKGKTIVNEYSPSLSEDEMDLRRISVINTLAKVFDKDDKSCIYIH